MKRERAHRHGLSNFLRNIPASVELTLPGSELDRDWRQSMTAAYFQDDVRLRDGLTLNVGVRYERTSVPDEVNGFSSNFVNPLTDAAPTIGPMPTRRIATSRRASTWRGIHRAMGGG